MMKQIMAIQKDESLTDAEKAVKRQQLLTGKWMKPPAAEGAQGSEGKSLEPRRAALRPPKRPAANRRRRDLAPRLVAPPPGPSTHLA